MEWALQDAKGKFSKLVDSALTKGPQLVTRRGKAAVIVMAVDQFRHFARNKKHDNLVNFFKKSPLAELDPKLLERDRDMGRSVDL